MNLLASFQQVVKEKHLFSSRDKLVLAVSGGIDSVVLCELCKQAGCEFIIAHCNFRLRGEESERDEQFVKKLGERYQVQVEVKQFDTEEYASVNKLSVQEAARELRYSWFAEIVKREESKLRSEAVALHLTSHVFLLTAHHADDNIETVLMNFFRGTGLHGLTGIPSKGDSSLSFVRRPLLDFSREEIVQFAKEHQLNFVEDSSNQSTKYTRNFFRHEIIPAISKVYPQVKENLESNISRFTEIEKLYRLSVNEIKKKLCKKKNNEIHIPVKQLMGYDNRALIYEIISEYGFSEKQVDEVIKLSESDSGKYIQSASFRIIRHRHWFIISPVVAEESENIIIEQSVDSIQLAIGSLEIRKVPIANYQLSTANSIACLDAKEITFPLLLRRWKAGDYFYPLGMRKKKKIARFLIDQKLSKTEKEKTWVVEMNNKIIWIVGQRIDERFKVTGKTTNVLQIRFISGQNG